MGRTYLRNGKTWYIEYYFKGKQYKERVGSIKDGITEKQARNALKSREGSIVQGKFDIAHKKSFPFFDKLMRKYLEWSETHKRSYARDLSGCKHLIPFFGNKRVNEITPLLIERYKKKRKDTIKAKSKNQGKNPRDISFSTINRELALLKHFYTMIIEWGVIDKNPVKRVRMFPEKPRERYLDEDEIVALLDACEKSQVKALKTIVITALYTGGRVKELLNLRIVDLDFKNSLINFNHTKTGENEKVPMAEDLKSVLEEYLKNHNYKYLFCRANGEPYKNIRRHFIKALKEAGIEDFRFHDLRHTFASYLAMNGIEGKTLQTLGRWKTPEMAMRYAHLSSKHMKKSVDILSTSFKNKYIISTKLISGNFSRKNKNV